MAVDAFVWFTHQPASTGWLKRELAAKRPDLRFAFSRPGLTTFKVDAERADEPNASSFAVRTTPTAWCVINARSVQSARGEPRVRTRSGRRAIT